MAEWHWCKLAYKLWGSNEFPFFPRYCILILCSNYKFIDCSTKKMSIETYTLKRSVYLDYYFAPSAEDKFKEVQHNSTFYIVIKNTN